MSWFTNLLGCAQHRLPSDADGETDNDLADARLKRQEAEDKLRQTRQMNGEVRRVSATAKRLRTANHFSASIAEAFGKVNNG